MARFMDDFGNSIVPAYMPYETFLARYYFCKSI
jgi:hypothetical protein